MTMQDYPNNDKSAGWPVYVEVSGDFWMPMQRLGAGRWGGPGRCWGAGGFYETCDLVGPVIL